jgi:hypothetical protein
MVGETREGGTAWKVLKCFAVLWTVLMAVAAVAGLIRARVGAATLHGEAETAGAAIGTIPGSSFIAAVWFFPVLGALVLGLFLRKSSLVEKGPTGALGAPGAEPGKGGPLAWIRVVGLGLLGLWSVRDLSRQGGVTGPPEQGAVRLAAVDDRFPHFGDGTHIVGADIQPGTYRTRSASPGCYYARLSGFTGSMDDVLANENTDAPAVVTILPGDRGFKSSRCGNWTKDLSAITSSRKTFGDGIFIVGTDVQAGTYQSSGASGCYYARLAGFTGSMDDTLANENTDSRAIVTIMPTDKGFKSARCGIWTGIASEEKSSAVTTATAEGGVEHPAMDDRFAHFGDGTHIVGADIQPGTYRTRSASPGCYYARLSGFTGSMDDVLANENTDAPAVVTILPGDKGFKSSRCGNWTKDLSAITSSPKAFGDGIFIVGTDVGAGTYQSSGGSGCYYARLAGFTGSMEETLANENTDSPAIVTIMPTDAGFKSARCGTWTRIP